VVLALFLASNAFAIVEGLYSDPDPASAGGISATVQYPELPIEKVVAVPADAPELAYAGKVFGEDRRSFRFEGLPMRRYDLLIVYEDRFYEGFALHRGDDTLTTEDRAGIERMIQASEPFFTHKIVHRLEGETGRGGAARCICTFLRAKGSLEKLEIERSEHRRTFKLVRLKQVGPGWQVVRARDLYPIYVEPERNHIDHHYSRAISRIRVTDKIKDLGRINLGGSGASPSQHSRKGQ